LATAQKLDGLIFLGAGLYGVVSGNLIASLGPELRLTRVFLARRPPVIGIGSGYRGRGWCRGSTVALCSGSRSPPQPRRACRSFAAALSLRSLYARHAGFATSCQGPGVRWRVSLRCSSCGKIAWVFWVILGFKTGMIEDLIMECEETPDGTAETLANLVAVQTETAAALGDGGG
jgi:hypothetical protein